MIHPPLQVPSVTTVLSHGIGLPPSKSARWLRFRVGEVGDEHAPAPTIIPTIATHTTKDLRLIEHSGKRSATSNGPTAAVHTSYGECSHAMGKGEG